MRRFQKCIENYGWYAIPASVFVAILVVGLYPFERVNERPATVEVCPTDVLSKSIIECARVANPMSDEEGEDLVWQCEQTMRRTHCEYQVIGVRVCTTHGFFSLNAECVIDLERRL